MNLYEIRVSLLDCFPGTRVCRDHIVCSYNECKQVVDSLFK